MDTERKQQFLLLAGIALNSGTPLVDRFLVSVPDWLAIVLMLLGCGCVIAYMVLHNRRTRKESK